MAWRRAFPDSEVAAFDPDAEALERAFSTGALTRMGSSPADAVRGVDLAVIAAPVEAISGIVIQVRPGLGPETIVTDTGSVKAPVISAVRSAAPDVNFIGGHPMAGSEQQGFAAARADLFAGAWWLLTPDSPEASAAADRLGPALRSLGAKVVEIEPAAHDRIMASISHLPMLVAASLVNLAGISIDGEDARSYAGTGFRDMTRIADSNPQLWLEVCIQNKTAVMEALSALATETARLERSLFDEDREGLLGFLSGARESRRRLPEKADRPNLTVVVVDVPDRPGTLATVSRVLGEAAINIEDIRVAHTPAGDRGWFFLTLESNSVPLAVQVLEDSGFRAEPVKR